jgi:hypothetical protein
MMREAVDLTATSGRAWVVAVVVVVAAISTGATMTSCQLAGGVPPDGIIASSIAARGDLVVPVPRTDWPGARRAVVSVDGTNDHSTLPGSPAAAREITLALAGEDPGCESLADTIADQVTGEAVSWAEDLVGADLALAARTVR